MEETGNPQSQTAEEIQQELEDLRLLHRISNDFSSTLDFDELLPRVFNDILDAVGAQGGSIWLTEGEELRCRLTMGSASQKLLNTTMPVGAGFVGDVARKQRSTLVTRALDDERFDARVDRTSMMITTTLIAAPMIAKGETVGAIQVTNKRVAPGIFEDRDRRLLEGLANAAGVALRNAQLHASEKKARDLSVLLDISREITSTLDVDRVLSSVVNQSTRALSFDVGAIGTVQSGTCTIRAMAGEEEIDEKSDVVKGLARRGEWTINRGEMFYLADAANPEGEVASAFLEAFGAGLSAAELRSGLYVPLKDEEGTLGVLVFESKTADFASEPQREIAAVLANQTAVALRNAELYNQVPMADLLGAITRRKRKLMEMPRRRVLMLGILAALTIVALFVVQWPFRVSGYAPVFRAVDLIEVRPLVDGVIERVLVAEGDAVERGAPIAQLRDFELRSEYEQLVGDLDAIQRSAADAANRGELVGERIYLSDAAAVSRQLTLVREQLDATLVVAPVAGTVLTPRPREAVGMFVEAGDHILTIGRTDVIELTMGVAQHDIERVAVGQSVNFRVASVPQLTFAGTVASVAELPIETEGGFLFEVRAVAENDGGMFRQGMEAHAKILTESESMAFRTLRTPVRALRLLWWRMRP